jgi:phosphatidylserine decarboxylase
MARINEAKWASMAKPEPLPIWDRAAGRLTQEFLDDHPSTYETKPRRTLTGWFQSHPLIDWGFAAMQHTARSARQIEPFVKKHGIDMSEFEPAIYRSYAEFFTRQFRPGVRTFPNAASEMGSFAEGRYFGWDKIKPDQEFPVKGHSLDAERILGSAERAAPFIGGPVLIARLSPLDYHRVHYIDDGHTISNDRIGGRLWTVTWKALQNYPDILFANERAINILQTRNFGRVAFAEIGAMTVGRVVQIHALEKPFKRGEEKALFQFGGSAIAVFGEPGRWKPARDIIEHTRERVETLVRLGDTIAHAAETP